MNGRILALLTICIVLASTISLSAWVLAHQGYPDTVYYEQLTVATSTSGGVPQPSQLWVDARRNVALRVTGTGMDRTSMLTVHDGQSLVYYEGSTVAGIVPQSPGEAAAFVRDNDLLLHGGFHALEAARLAHAVGPVRRLWFAGRPALVFDTSLHSDDLDRFTVWLDAHTLQPLQLQVAYSGYVLTQRIVQVKRLPPGSLPADFFEPPRSHPNYWNQAVSWLRDKLGRG